MRMTGLEIITADGGAELRKMEEMRARAGAISLGIDDTVREILADVKARGAAAVGEYSLRFDGAQPYEIPKEELEAAYAACPPDLRSALRRAAANIRAYHERLLPRTEEWTSPDGGRVGQMVRGLSRVGIYVPGGTAAYPSSVLMNAIPAKVAGVEELIMVTPPTAHLNNAVLAAAKIGGVDRVFAVGGAQAVAALAYGAGPIPRVDKLVGPGNAYVAAAKRMVYGTIDIDMVAGPSEVLILADASANVRYIAADLLGQAEHDELASAVLLTTDRPLAEAVNREIARQCAGLGRREIIEASLGQFGCAIVCQTLEQAADLANLIAPEHLEIMTAAPRSLLPRIKNAGAVFLGEWSPEALGDYMAGPSHVLPTSGTARFFSPLSVEDFIKTTSVIEYDRAALGSVAEKIIAIAQAEQLTAHAGSIRVRLEGEG